MGAVYITLELTIDERLAATAQKKLSEIAGDSWDVVTSEIQDDGTFLLLKARIAWGEPKEVSPELRCSAAAALNDLIPQHPQQEVGSWMLGVWYGDAMVDCIFPDEL